RCVDHHGRQHGGPADRPEQPAAARRVREQGHGHRQQHPARSDLRVRRHPEDQRHHDGEQRGIVPRLRSRQHHPAAGHRLRRRRLPPSTFATVFFAQKPTVIVAGLGGNDTYTIDNPASAVDLAHLTTQGDVGNDTFHVVTAFTAAVTFHVDGGGGNNTLIGPDL